MTVRPLTPRDLPALLRMMRDLCAFHGDPCTMGLADAQTLFLDGARLIGLVAVVDGDCVGYAALEPKWNPTVPGPSWDIAHLFVVEPKRGMGIGTALIKAASARVLQQSAARLTIGTAPTNDQAAAAYRAMGLQELHGPSGARFEVPLAEQK